MLKRYTDFFSGWVLMTVFGAVMAGAPATVAAAGGLKPGQHTVVRHPQGGSTTTVERKGSCVLDLTAPKTTASCRLSPTDPPAKLIVKGWYKDRGISDLGALLLASTPKERDKITAAFLSAKGKSPEVFFGADLLVVGIRYLDAPPGGVNRWTSSRSVRYYTKDELKQAKDAVLKWAEAWREYRGSQFGK